MTDAPGRKRITRDEVIECPHLMALLDYSHHRYGLPRYGYEKRGLRYHYTDARGLLGIIESSRLWASDIRFLNDPSEGKFFPARLFSLMKQRSRGLTELESRIINGIQSKITDPRISLQAFCVSFSAAGDLLSQWRGYGAFGRGYAIGFNFDRNPPHPQIAQYHDICYGDIDAVALSDDLLDIFVESFKRRNSAIYDGWAFYITLIGCSFKDEHYSEEQESRIIYHHSDVEKDDITFLNEAPLKFREKNGDIIPYIPLALDLMRDGDPTPKLPIESIVVGPGLDYALNRSTIEQLLKKNGYEDIEVKKSSIPFRP